MRTLTISVAMLKNWARSRSGVFFSVLFPVMLLLIFATIFGGDGSSEYVLYTQNLDLTTKDEPTELSMSFLDLLNETGAFDLNIVPPEVEPRDYVQDELGTLGSSFRLLIIPSGFQSDLTNGSLRARLGVVSSTTRTFIEEFGQSIPTEQRIGIEQGLEQLEKTLEPLPARNVTLVYVADPSDMSSAIVRSIIDNLVKAYNYGIIGVESNVEIESESVVERGFEAIDFYVPGIIGAFIMTNGIIGVTTNTTEFKRRGILKRFATTPLTRLEWVLGNVITQTILSFLLVIVMITVAWVFFGMQAMPNLLTLVIIVAGAVMFSGIGLILAGMVTDVEAASAAANAIAFPMMFLSGTFFPMEMMPSYLQTFAQVLPLTYLSEGMRAALVYDNVTGGLTNLGIISILAVVFIVIGSAATRWQER